MLLIFFGLGLHGNPCVDTFICRGPMHHRVKHVAFKVVCDSVWNIQDEIDILGLGNLTRVSKIHKVYHANKSMKIKKKKKDSYT